MIPNPRYEIKFVLDINRLAEAENWMYQHTTARQSFAKRTVNSLYFDDPGFSSVRDNIAGVSDRQKIRMRWYSGDEINQRKNPKLEIKYRHGRLGGKDTLHLPEHWEDGLGNKEYKDIYPLIQKELCENPDLPQDSALFPTLQVSYDRTYFEDLNGIRITFDNNIQFSNPIPHMKVGANKAVSYASSVMEIKFPQEKKNNVANYIRSLNLTPKRHSKYLAGLATFGYVSYI